MPFKQLKLKFPKKYAFKIYLCSGLSLKPVTLGGGVTAWDFSGNISVILTNHSTETLQIEQNFSNVIFKRRRRGLCWGWWIRWNWEKSYRFWFYRKIKKNTQNSYLKNLTPATSLLNLVLISFYLSKTEFFFIWHIWLAVKILVFSFFKKIKILVIKLISLYVILLKKPRKVTSIGTVKQSIDL